MFTEEVIEKLQYYVYRLIDPRNGETFYVGKGKGNRVFEHVQGVLKDKDEDKSSLKISHIKSILNDGFEIQHIIHRHGMDENTAFEVEAALIDAYPSTSNIVSGHRSNEFGVMHSKQIIRQYEAKEIIFEHNLLLITVNRSTEGEDARIIYDAVRHAWKLDIKRAKNSDYILAMRRGICVGVFQAIEWFKATKSRFPSLSEDMPERWGFEGHEAEDHIKSLYLHKRIPTKFVKRGAANPIKYFSPKDNTPTINASTTK